MYPDVGAERADIPVSRPSVNHGNAQQLPVPCSTE